MSATAARHNPFTANATTTDAAGVGPPGPTFETGPVRPLRTVLAGYLERVPDPSGNRGVAVLLSGEHGSGKTHAALYVRAELMSGRLALRTRGADVPTSRPVFLYA